MLLVVVDRQARQEPGTDQTISTQVSSRAGATSPPRLRQPFLFFPDTGYPLASALLSRYCQSSDLPACTSNSCATRHLRHSHSRSRTRASSDLQTFLDFNVIYIDRVGSCRVLLFLFAELCLSGEFQVPGSGHTNFVAMYPTTISAFFRHAP